jgi:prepilin-type N-terminal cleavage/methylation domain-containing protein
MRRMSSLFSTQHPHTEDGFGLIEVLVSMFILVVGMLALLTAFDSASKLSLLSERQTAMAHRAQMEIERLQATSYKELEMKTTPAHSSSTISPDYYVAEGTPAEYQYGTNTSEKEKLVISAKEEGAIATEPKERACSKYIGACEWTDGNVSGYVYDFITRHSELSLCKIEAECPKRLTVVVTTNVPAGSAPNPVRVSTLLSEPTSSK